MINTSIAFDLPLPWRGGRFEMNRLFPVNFLVGPNGSGKSQFARTVRTQLGNARLLGTDRLSGMEQSSGLRGIFGDPMREGMAKNHFDYFRQAASEGLAIDTILLLEERMDLRIQVEATLSHLFHRSIALEWDSGHLVAKASLGDDGTSYRLDRDECHGIKELLVLLTHLYNDAHDYLVIDEPELNLHPQYQAFFMQEVRKVAGNPADGSGKKVVFLITHSPFILDFRTIEDVQAVVAFSLDHGVPRQMAAPDAPTTRKLQSLVPRLNVHHKQLFFSDNPIFVEGILDAQLLGAVQNARNVSVAGAGSCIIDANGNEEVNRYVELCSAFGKQAHFLYDLDSLFTGNLRACIKGDGEVQDFLAAAGLGNDLGGYCGELDKKLTALVDRLLTIQAPHSLDSLVEYIRSLGDKATWVAKSHGRARVALLTAISRQREDMCLALTPEEVSGIEGRLTKIVEALAAKRIRLLPGGTLERYLPAYTGSPYQFGEEAKRAAVNAEIEYLAEQRSEEDLAGRYGTLFEVIKRLPAKSQVNVDNVLKIYVSRYIHDLQAAVVAHATWDLERLRGYMAKAQAAAAKVFTLREFDRRGENRFRAVIGIIDMLGQGERQVVVDERTNAGMSDFTIENAPAAAMSLA